MSAPRGWEDSEWLESGAAGAATPGTDPDPNAGPGAVPGGNWDAGGADRAGSWDAPGADRAGPGAESHPAAAGGSDRLSGLGDLMDQTIQVMRWAPGPVWLFGGGIVAALAIVEGVLAATLGLGHFLDSALSPGAQPASAADLAAWGGSSQQLGALLASAAVSIVAWVTTLVAGALCAGVGAVVVRAFWAGKQAPEGGPLGRHGGHRDLPSGPAAGRGALPAPPSGGQVWRRLRPRAVGAVGFALLLPLTVAALVAVAAGVTALAVSVAPPLALLVFFLALIGAGVAAFWLLPPVALAVPEHVTPTRGGPRPGTPHALARSWDLARGRRWRLVGIWLLCVIVLGLASSAIAAPFGWLASATAGAAPVASQIALIAGSTISAAVLAPIGAIVLAVVHRDLAAPGGASQGPPPGAAA